MRTVLALAIALLPPISITSIAATVDYQDPDLTIVAKQEPLDAVLKALGKEMRIYITIPTGLNRVVSCDIQRQSVKQAFKTLLGEMSYSLEWEKETGQIVGLTILAGEGESAVAKAASSSSHNHIGEQSAPVPVAPAGGQGAKTLVGQDDHEVPVALDDTAIADHDIQMEEHEARMETERAAMATRMVEEREVQEERIEAEIARHEIQHNADLQDYLGSKGLQMPRQAD